MKKYIIFVVMAIFFVGCGAKKPIYEVPLTHGELFKPLYDENPTSVLILPAVDQTTSADASELFSYTILPFLAEKGYYVFSPSLVDEFLKSENITEPKLARQIPLEKIQEVFNPDAILYVDISQWDTDYKVLSSGVSVWLRYALRGAKSDELLWLRGGYASSVAKGQLDTGSLLGLVVSAAISATAAAINTATDYQKLALEANYGAYYNLPVAKYHYDYPKEQNELYGTLKIYDTDLENFAKRRQKDKNAKLSVTVYADKKMDGRKLGNGFFFYVKTDENGNIIEKNGKPILDGGVYVNDKNKNKESK